MFEKLCRFKKKQLKKIHKNKLKNPIEFNILKLSLAKNINDYDNLFNTLDIIFTRIKDDYNDSKTD